MKENFGKTFNSEESVEIPRSYLHTIMHKTTNQTVLAEEAFLSEGADLAEEAIARTGQELKSDNAKTTNQTVFTEEAFLSEGVDLVEGAIARTGNEIKSEIGNNLVRQIQNHLDIAVADKKKFIHKNGMPPIPSNPISENSQGPEVSSGDSVKNLFDGSTMTKEQLKARESLQVVENIKAHEGAQIKASINDMEESAREAKSRFSDGFQISEKNKLASESQSLIRSKLSDFSKPNEGFKVTEDLQGQTKVKVSEDLLTKEMFRSPDELKETVKAKENFLNTVTETTKVSSEKLPVGSINQFRTLAAKETKLSGNSNSGVESVMSSGISASSETSGTSIFKTPDSMNSSSESLRNVELPFDIKQLVSRVRIMRGNGVEEMTLRLHPEELGHITLKVKQSGGDLFIDMRVDNPLAKQMVESGFDSLRSRFLDQEFAYKDLALNVDINEKDSQFGSDRQFEEFEEELFSSLREKEQEISTLEETPLERHRTDSGLNLYV